MRNLRLPVGSATFAAQPVYATELAGAVKFAGRVDEQSLVTSNWTQIQVRRDAKQMLRLSCRMNARRFVALRPFARSRLRVERAERFGVGMVPVDGAGDEVCSGLRYIGHARSDHALPAAVNRCNHGEFIAGAISRRRAL